MKKSASATSIFSTFVLVCGVANADPQYITFSVPDANTTIPISINTNNDVTGMWFDSQNQMHGFVRSGSGAITTFDAKKGAQTYPIAINDSGTITGGLNDSMKQYVFIRSPDGQITTFKNPNGPTNTGAADINDGGWVAGSYQEPNGTYGNAFLLSPDGQLKETQRKNAFVNATALNNANVLTGSYQSQEHIKGFVLAPDGKMEKFSAGSEREQTFPRSINDAGTIAGYVFVPNKERYRGFVRTADGAITVFDGPEGRVIQAASINKDGTVTGTYYRNANAHAFIRTADGTFTSFDVSGSKYTRASSINDNGVVAGQVDSIGFIRIP